MFINITYETLWGEKKKKKGHKCSQHVDKALQKKETKWKLNLSCTNDRKRYT